ncbi:MAG: dGTPase, partial [Lutibacter sp.]|nr:dGTPase [Lutibacter sp.]
DKCIYEAQINDIIKLSVEKIYKSREVIEKELVGYNVIATLLDVFVSASNRKYENSLTNYDKLILNLLPESLQEPKENLYLRILSICGYVASLTDGYALELFKKLKG